MFPILLVLFAASGCAALIYEIVWLQLLQLVVGSTAVSMAVLLSAYMGGLVRRQLSAAAGGFDAASSHARLCGHRVGHRDSGSCGAHLIPLARSVYVAAIGLGMPGMLLRGLLCGLCLLPPTLLMGASLPAMARWVESNAEGRLAAGAALWREYGRRRARLSRGGLLSAAGLRHADGYVRRRGDQWADGTRQFPAGIAHDLRRVNRTGPVQPVAARRVADIRGHCVIGPHGAGRRGGVDAPAVAAAGRHGLHVRYDSGGIPGRHRLLGSAAGSSAGSHG